MNKPKKPLSGMKKKEKSYIGNLDDLMKDTVDEELDEGDTSRAAQAGEEGSTDASPAESSDSASVVTPEEEGGGDSDEGMSTRSMKEATSETSPEPGQEAKSYKHLNLKIDATLHRQFKGIVGMQGTTMTDVLEGMISRYVEEKKSELL